MEQPTCKTCRWWGADRKRYEETEAAPCSCPKLVDIDARGYGVVSGNGFGLDYPVCDLWTGPDFGCVHHERKEGA